MANGNKNLKTWVTRMDSKEETVSYSINNKPVDDSVLLQPRNSNKAADKNCSFSAAPRVALSNPLHFLLSLNRRCKDTIVLTVLQPQQVIQWGALPFIFSSLKITPCPRQSQLFSLSI